MIIETAESKHQRRFFWNSIFWGIVALASVTVVTTIVGPPQFPGVRESLQVSGVVFLCICLGFWVGLGYGFARLPASVIGTLFVGGCFGFGSIRNGRGDAWLYFVFCYSILAIVAATLFLLRRTCGRLRQEETSVKSVDGLQFSVRQVMIWTAIVAVVLTVFRQLKLSNLYLAQEVVFLVISTTCFFSAMSVLQISVWLSRRITFGKILSVVFVVGVFLVFCGAVLDDGFFWAIIGLGSQILTAASIYCLRKQDYRFVKLAES